MRNNTIPKILIIGLGEIGYANAEYLTKIGLRADGYDINRNTTKRAIWNKVIAKEPKTFEDYDYYLICVSTHNPQNMFTPSFDGLTDIIQRLTFEGKEGALVAIESTISKNLCDRLLKTLDHRLHIAHVPHRYYVKEKEKHGVKQLRVLGGFKPCCAKEARKFYGSTLGIPLHEVSSLKIAAFSKVVENTYRFLEIAFAEELKLICDFHDLDFEELRGAVNTKWNVNILEAQQGIGGHCLPKDTQMYLDMTQTLSHSILETAVDINKEFETKLLDTRTSGAIPFEKNVVNIR